MTTEITYPLDLAATLASNKITDELIRVNPLSSPENWYLIPKNGLFYGHTLKVYIKSIDSDGGIINTPLKLGYDYFPTLPYNDLNKKLSFPVFGAIEILNQDLTGEIYISYQFLGGIFYINTVSIFKQIALSLSKDRLADWSTIVDVPSEFPPEVHNHVATELTGFDALSVSILGRSDILKDVLEKGLAQMVEHCNDVELHTFTAEKLKLDAFVGMTIAGYDDVISNKNTAVLTGSSVPALVDVISEETKVNLGITVGDLKRSYNITPDLPYTHAAGQRFRLESYPELAALFGDGVIPDLRDGLINSPVWLIKIKD